MEKFGQDLASMRVPAGELRELLSRLASSDGVMDSDQPTIRDVAEVSGKSIDEVAASLVAMRGSQVVIPAGKVAKRPQVAVAIVAALALLFILLGTLLVTLAPVPPPPRTMAAPAASSPGSWPPPPGVDTEAPSR